MSSRALPGFRDFYPSELAERAYIMRAWRRIANRYAFVEYDGPPLEPLELYTKKSGDEIVGQLYSFTDKGGREVSLRPEMTPTFARMVGAQANALRKPVRWFSIPQLFRYERQQRGRLREHFQLNVDMVGEADVTADAELLAVAIDIMRELGLTREDVVARVSDRRLLAALLVVMGVPAETHGAVFAAIDKVEREPLDRFAARLAEAGIDARLAGDVYAMVRGRSIDDLRAQYGGRDEALDEAFARLDRYRGYLRNLGCEEWVRIDLTIVRGLAYYTGIVFELFDLKGELRAICGGGRYDTLLESLGGVNLPALGFGMGDVVLRELLIDRGLMPKYEPGVDFWVAGDAERLQPIIMHIATLLRRLDFRVEYALRPQSLARQLKSAAAAGADRVVLLQEEQLRTEATLTVKRLSDGLEERAPVNDWIEHLIAAAAKKEQPPEPETV